MDWKDGSKKWWEWRKELPKIEIKKLNPIKLESVANCIPNARRKNNEGDLNEICNVLMNCKALSKCKEFGCFVNGMNSWMGLIWIWFRFSLGLGLV